MSPIVLGAPCVIILLLFVSQWSWWLSLLSVLLFAFGYVVSDYLLPLIDDIPDFSHLFSNDITGANVCRRRLRFVNVLDSGSESTACNVCGSDSCNRRPGNETASDACCSDSMLGPKIPEVVDDALQEFFDMTLKTYVDSWYEAYISQEDKAFVKQVRTQIQRALCRLYVRLRDVDLAHLILDEILPVAVNHAAIYCSVHQQNVEETEFLEERVLLRLSAKGILHPALQSRSCELSYLKRLVDYVLGHCADKSLSTATMVFLREIMTFEVVLPAVDAAADPHVVNRILELFFDPVPMRTIEGELSKSVVLLERFADEKNPYALADTVVFQYKLSEIIRDPPMLYVFMTYLKSINAPMNWLQFILSAHDIQERLHSGRNLTREEISHLHWQSWELYRNYLHEGAPDKLGDDIIPASIVEELRLGVEGEPVEAISRISPVLEQAYQIMYQHVQWRYVSPFCQSAKFMEMICDTRHHATDEGECLDSSMRVDEILEEIDGSLRMPENASILRGYVDVASGNSCDLNSGSSSNSDQGSEEEEALNVQEQILAAELTNVAALKDLSQWKLALPRIEPRRDPQTARTMYVYVIEVEADEGSRRWFTDRRYREFFVLESKLVEFHGESVLGGFPLPPKKTFNNKSRAFVESQRPIFDQFLKRLLHNPSLNRSELLYAFLTSANELTASFLPDPFKVMRKVPGKLARERGQNLSSFLQALVTSVLQVATSDELKPAETSGRVSPYPDRLSLLSLGDSTTSRKVTLQDKVYGTQYKNNFGSMTRSASVLAGTGDESAILGTVPTGDQSAVRGVYDALLFLGIKLLQIPYLTWVILASARCLLRRTFDGYVSRYVRRKLSEAMHEKRMVTLIHSLRDLVFNDESSGDESEAKSQRKRNALMLAELYFNTELALVKKSIGSESFDRGLTLIFNCLQCPRLNKQLFYVLLDVVAREIFPELL